MSDVQKVLDQLTAADAAIAAGRYGLQGEYRIAATLLQLAGALQAREPQPAPAPLRYEIAYVPAGDVPAAQAPDGMCGNPHMPPHRARTFPVACGTCSAPLQPVPAPEPPVKASMHPPTTCVHRDPDGAPCGELIRFTEANGWYHVNDRRLGASTHSATPQVTPGPLPTR